MNHLFALVVLISVTSGKYIPDKNARTTLPVGLLGFYKRPDRNVQKGFVDIVESPFRVATSVRAELWPHGVVPYVISNKYQQWQKDLIEKEMRTLEDLTRTGENDCVRFVPQQDTSQPHINIVISPWCSSPIGRQGGAQDLSLGLHCIPKDVIHELMHALGFWHEQQRPDRDNYVTFYSNNIGENSLLNFEKKTVNVTTLSLPYDYDSVMHYPRFASTINGRPTLVPKNQNYIGGLRDQLHIPMSPLDVRRVQRLYNCTEDLTNYRRISKRDLEVVCTFEKDLCNLTQSTNDGFDWVRRRRFTSRHCNDTFGDHTYGNGYYLSAVVKNHMNQKAVITTPTLKPGQYCISFAYFATSKEGSGTLQSSWASGHSSAVTILQTIRIYPKDYIKVPVWQNYRSWVNVDSDWHAILTVDVGGITDGFIALDDFVIYKSAEVPCWT